MEKSKDTQGENPGRLRNENNTERMGERGGVAQRKIEEDDDSWDKGAQFPKCIKCLSFSEKCALSSRSIIQYLPSRQKTLLR